jgi:hypothetical protein
MEMMRSEQESQVWTTDLFSEVSALSDYRIPKNVRGAPKLGDTWSFIDRDVVSHPHLE